ncbi:MAG: autotransporter domain-containing protein [Novosphingobium sp.]|jgi:outer membrane autotransporter protein|nr:autotransporter domain-containing protein [Novosphingobium sp.]
MIVSSSFPRRLAPALLGSTALACLALATPALASNTTTGNVTADGATVPPGTQSDPWNIPNTGELRVGNTSTGTMSITTGSLVAGSEGYVGFDAGISGTVTVTGTSDPNNTASEWLNSGGLYIGHKGTGILNIEAGGLVENADGFIGNEANSEGTVKVTGTDSSWWSYGDLVVGAAGKGTLNIFDGGIAGSFTGVIARDAKSTGTVVVSGVNGSNVGSSLSISGGFDVGRNGIGVLDIKGGGWVRSGLATIGANAGATGTVTIDGRFSEWLVTGNMIVGGNTSGTDGGVGSLTLSNDAAVTFESNRDINGGLIGSMYVGAVQGSGGGTLAITAGTATIRAAEGYVLPAVYIGDSGVLQGVSGAQLFFDAKLVEFTKDARIEVALGAPENPHADVLFKVNGDLTFADGTKIGVTKLDNTFGKGLYRVFSYEGDLTDNGLAVDTAPAGYVASVQDETGAKEVNLIVEEAAPPPDDPNNPEPAPRYLNFWDGTNTVANNKIDGGTYVWDVSNTNWTDQGGVTNAAYDRMAFLYFMGTKGTVTVDAGSNGVLEVGQGMQFAKDGYVIQGDGLDFGVRDVEIRVGDGTSAGAGFTAEIKSALSGSGDIAKTDLGKLVLTGTSSFTGTTTVRKGTLAVNGAIAGSAVTVQDTARIQGTGTVGWLTVEKGGTAAPGNSIGTLNVAGDLVFEKGSILEAEINAAGQADLIHAGGSADIQGGTVNVLAGNGNYSVSKIYTLITADEGRSGTFDALAITTDLAYMNPYLDYDTYNVYLKFQRNRVKFPDPCGTFNEKAAGGGTESLGSGNAIYNAVLQMNQKSACDAFDQVSGEVHASMITMGIEDSRFVREAALDRMRATDCDFADNETWRKGEDRDRAAAACAANGDRRATVWGRAFGSWGHTNSDGNAARLERSIGGFFVGADGLIADNVRIGYVLGYSRTDFNVKARTSSGISDNIHAGAYIGGVWGGFALGAGASYTYHKITTSRTVTFAGFNDSLKANYDARTWQVFGEASYRAMMGASGYVEPFANVAHVTYDTGSFTEQGGIAALTSNGAKADVTFTTLGARVAAGLGGRTTLKGMAGWRHAFVDQKAPLATMAFLTGGDAFTVAGVPIAKDTVVVDAGIDFAVSQRANLGLRYNGQYGNGLTDNGARLNFSVKF